MAQLPQYPDPNEQLQQQPNSPQTPQQPWYNNQDINSFQSWAQTRYGRQATPQELAQIGQNSTNMTSAQSYADTLARQQGWTPQAGQTSVTPTMNTPGTSTAIDQALQDRIQQALATNTGDVNTGSQEYQSQLGAFKRSQQGQLERAKRNAAERAAQGGTLNTGGFDAGMQTLDLAGAQQVGDFEAQLAGQQIGRQREDLQNAMALASQAGLTNEARQLQERLGSADLDLRRYLGRGQLGLGLLGTLLGDKQANNRLGFDYFNAQNMANQNTINSLLGGL